MSSTNNVLEYQLDNGLGLLIKPDHTAPLASLWTWYRVGSRNERPGLTGVSHWVEHMQFKGTPSLAKGQIFSEVSRVGGTLNALTSMDWTAYFETVPVSALDLPIMIESDRIENSLFAPEEVEAERTVILSERQGAMNNPGYLLYQEVLSQAFRLHSYRNMVIGLESDLRVMSREDLFQHYRDFYQPANAFIVAVGDFESDALKEKIERAFGELPNRPNSSPLQAPPQEPAQPGERRVLLRRPAGSPYLRMAFHAPAAPHPDVIPLLVADAILSGGKPMGFGGSGGMGRSSRLYKALVAGGLARTASSDFEMTLDPFLFQVAVTALPGAELETIEEVIDRELEVLRDEPVPEDELQRALRQVEAQFVYSSEGVTNQAYWLGQCYLLGNWQRALTLPEEIRTVSAADVMRIAETYFNRDQRTVGWLEPNDTGPSGDTTAFAAAHDPTGLEGASIGTGDTTLGNEHPFARASFDDGLVILGQDRPVSRSVSLRLRVAAGAIHEPSAKPGLAYLTARSLLRGAGGRSFAQINERIDSIGGSIAVDSGREFVEIRLRSLAEGLPEMIKLLAQIVLNPDFEEHQIELVRNEQIGAISEADNDTRATADRIMRQGVYPEPNPLRRRVLGSPQIVASLTRDDVYTFWSTVYRASNLTFAVVGGLNGFGRISELITNAFQRSTGEPLSILKPELLLINKASIRHTERIAGKSQADLAIGLATISRLDPNYYALDIANHILGRQGLMGRLGSEVRDRQGLAYYAHSQIEPRRDGSLWVARAGVDPANVERALHSIQHELTTLQTTGVTAEELGNAQSHLIGVLPLALETHDGVAATLLAVEEFDLGPDYLDRYPGFILAVDRERCLDVAMRYLDPARIVVGVAEPAGAQDAELVSPA